MWQIKLHMVMCKKLQVNPIINDLLCVPFENLHLNDNTCENCVEVFKNDILDDATNIVTPKMKKRLKCLSSCQI